MIDYPGVLLWKIENGIATITLNRPEQRNTLDFQVVAALSEAFREAAENDNIKVLVLTSTGKYFSAGGDVNHLLSESAKGGADEKARRLEFYLTRNMLPTLSEQIDKPTICAVQGPAVGLGMDVTLACDMRIAAETARFAESFVLRGIVPNGACWLLPRIVGWPRACELIFTGGTVDAAEALRIGLVNRVVPADQLESATYELAERIAKNPPLAVRFAKRIMQKGVHTDADTNMQFMTAAQTILLESRDHQEALTAFLEKREGKYVGQ